MDLKSILEKFAQGQLTLDEAQRQLSIYSIEYVGDNLARLDVGREIRKEVPEVIFAKGKEHRDIFQIVLSTVKRRGQVVVSKIQKEELFKLCNITKKKKPRSRNWKEKYNDFSL